MLTSETSSVSVTPLGTTEELLAQLRTSIDGLRSGEAAERLQFYGPNEPQPVRPIGPLTALVRFCANPLVLILLAASLVSALLGQNLDAGIIAAMILLSVVL